MDSNNRGKVPYFSGKKEELNEFVDTILKQMTIDELAYYAKNNEARTGIVTESGMKLPASASGGRDCVAGVETDLPMPVHIGQAWDKALAKEVGQVIGDERRGQLAADDPNALTYTAMADVRCNPLSGRYYEGYSEDPYLTAEMVDYTGNGCIGDDDFYIKTQVGTKHFANYHSEWDRTSGSYIIQNRTMKDYQFPSFYKGFKNNHLVGTMTSYGATNGMSNAASPYVAYLQERYGYSLFNICDYDGDYNMKLSQSNGYDKAYMDSDEGIAALLIKGKVYPSTGKPGRISVEAFASAVRRNLFGISRTDLEEYVRPQIELWARHGYFTPDVNPYKHLSKDHNPVTADSKSSQDTALRAAEEGMVLLKHSNAVLPLSENARVMVTGLFMDSRYQVFYASETPAGIAHTKLTPKMAFEEYLEGKSGTAVFAPELSGMKLRLKSENNNKYVTAERDGKLSTGSDETGDEFLLYDWGQSAYSLYHMETDSFLAITEERDSVYLEKRDPYAVPTVWTKELTDNGNWVFRTDVFTVGFMDRIRACDDYPFYQRFTHSGLYLAVDNETAQLVPGKKKEENYGIEEQFAVEIISEAGEGAELYAKDCDYAVVMIGEDSFIGTGEFVDRMDIAPGSEQLKLVKQTAAAFPGKTIVVVRTDAPLGIEDIEKDDNVAAILYASYAGQYDSWALLRTLYGEHNPSGRLTGTWLKDISSLPKLREREDIDPQFTVDMKQADAAQWGLSYMYNEREDVLYPFGFGLSYTDFEYSNMSVVEPEDSEYTWGVRLRVKNTGDRYGRTVVQLYMSSVDSGYGTYVPKKQLVGFEKTPELAPGESIEIIVRAYEAAYKKWDTGLGTYIVEKGRYQLAVGTSAEDLLWREEIQLDGAELTKIEMWEPVNVWEVVTAAYGVQAIEVSKKRSVSFEGDYFAVQSVQQGDSVLIKNVTIHSLRSIRVSAATTKEKAQMQMVIENKAGSMAYDITLQQTEPVSCWLDKEKTIPSTELSYVWNEIDASNVTDSVYDIYIEFQDADIRLESIQLCP